MLVALDKQSNGMISYAPHTEQPLITGNAMAEESTKIALLEYQMKQTEAKIDDIAHKVDGLVELLQQAKGARWTILAMSGVGGFIAAKGAAITSWIGSIPK